MFELDGIKVLCHSSIRIAKEKKIYIDPYKIQENYNDADLILCTHSHYDHFSIEDIQKVIGKYTKIFIQEESKQELINIGVNEENIIIIKPYEKYEYEESVRIETIPAYNKNKNYHPKDKNWVGYIIEIENTKYYIAGDTDYTKEASKVKCDVAFLPIGGTYTMDYIEAAALANKIKPKFVIPIHYGTIVGDPEDGVLFKDLIDKKIKCVIL